MTKEERESRWYKEDGITNARTPTNQAGRTGGRQAKTGTGEEQKMAFAFKNNIHTQAKSYSLEVQIMESSWRRRRRRRKCWDDVKSRVKRVAQNLSTRKKSGAFFKGSL